MIVDLFPRSTKQHITMPKGPRMSAAELADKPLLSDEHADTLRKPVAWMVVELVESEVTSRIGAELAPIPRLGVDRGRPGADCRGPQAGEGTDTYEQST
jgi:hypothetical protein